MGKLCKMLLALTMAVSMFSLPAKASTTNLALNKTVTASDYEVASTSPSKAVDGDYSSRWGTNQNALQNEWIEIDLGSAKTVRQIKVFFERATAEQNITSFKVELYNNGSYTKVYQKDTRAAQEENILLDQDYTASKVKLTVLNGDGGTMGWVNVGINEIEVYDENQASVVSAANVANTITGGVIDTGTYQLEVANLPEGFTAKIVASDFEEIVNKAGKIANVLEDKEVKIVWEVSNADGSDVARTNELTYTIKSSYKVKDGANEKPDVIPEISEWNGSTGFVAFENITSITCSESALQPVVEEFVNDYKAMTNKPMELVAVGGDIQMDFDSSFVSNYGEEGYGMNIAEDGVFIQSGTVTGIMYALQTLLQMTQLYDEGYPCGTMRDYPRFEVRGLLLDVARKPISMDMIEMIGRTMRYYKMNDYQIHLSDNYIFLENYGKGANEMEAFKAYDAFRLECDVTNDKGESPTATDYFFTKEDFRNYIQKERALGMNIIPEIDMPAHANSFTKIWPELMVQGMVSSLNSNRPLIDHFDVSKPETIAKIKEIFDDYTKGTNPTFDSETVVHIGADEFLANYTAYRQFVNEVVPYIKETNTVRMWGGLTWINDGKTEIVKEAIEDVQMNLWSCDWASGIQMYNMGYELINTIDDYGYMVPNGNGGRSNAYGDYLNVERIFNTFEPNRIRNQGGGYAYIPAGDDQMLGSAYAIWSDNIDKNASGLDESDYFHRFFDALPFYAEKNWATTGKEKGTAENLQALTNVIGVGPVNPYYQVDEKDYFTLDFAETETGNVVLDEATDYVETTVERAGWGNMLSFDLTLTAESNGKVLFESDAAYGTHDIRINENGKLGFTRELFDYEFNYVVPVNEKVNIAIVSSQEKTDLYVNGVFVATAIGSYTHNDILKKTNINNASFAIATQRIGSKTNAASAIIDNVVLSDAEAVINPFKKENWTGEADTETIYTATEGEFKFAFDKNLGTIWHSNWQGASDKLTGSNTFTGEIDLGAVYNIKGFTMTPRQDGNLSGVVTKADLYVKENVDDAWVKVADNVTFAATADVKTMNFDSQNVRYIKFVAKQSNDGWVAVAEFDLIKGDEEIVKPEVDKSGLLSAIEPAEQVFARENEYTAESFAVFKAAYEAALAVYNDANATQADVDAAKKALVSAEKGLIVKPIPTVPAKVENVVAKDTNYKTITLTWDASEGATAYDVYRKAYDSEEFKLYKTVADTTLAVSGGMTGKEYAFYVVAKNEVGEAEVSEIVTQATTLHGEVALNIEQVSTSTFKLSWNKIDGATRYIVYRKRNDDKMKKVLTLGVKDLEYTTAELPYGDYQFILKAGRYDSKDRVMTDSSNTVEVSVEKVAPVVTLKAGTKSVKVSWKAMEGVTHYQVYRAASVNGKYTKLTTTKELSYTAKSLNSGKKYFFKVRGYKNYKSGEDIQYNVYTPYSTVKNATAK